MPKLNRGVVMMVAIFLMVVVGGIVISTLDTMLQYAANRNTLAWDKARYMAESGVQHACALLEANPTWRTGSASTELPAAAAAPTV